ncbi:hypothetical protein TH606_01760 [Thermodesulfatator autotrophicus]|uniref:ParB/Sulfiredoxin domain-containing protein n=1 Tax=Thermodesulfatator autotrophicus TaxID=1795632 RepID=A0A177E917_9BACT|nr:hypothetical protein TH606_01760 [Thermodesulfatator autotrophicus]
MTPECKLIYIEKINFEDKTYFISYPSRATHLKESVKRVGVIVPPLLKLCSKGFQIISGWGRLEAARELNFEKIICHLLPPEADELFCLNLVVEENLTSRGLNLVEKALAVEKYRNYISDEEIIKEILPRLGLPPHYYHFETLRAISSLGEETWELVVAEKLNPKVATRLAKLDERSRKRFLLLLKELKLSISRQRLLWEMLEDLSRKSGKSFELILEEDFITSLLNEKNISFQQKTEKLFKWLAHKLRPVIAAREEKAKVLSRSLHKLGAKIEIDPSGEKDLMRLEIAFKSLEELEKKWFQIKETLAKQL